MNGCWCVNADACMLGNVTGAMPLHISAGLSHQAIVIQVASAFSQMLNLHNLSEEISNAQIEKASRIGEVTHHPGHITLSPLGFNFLTKPAFAAAADRVIHEVHEPLIQKVDTGAEGVARGYL